MRLAALAVLSLLAVDAASRKWRPTGAPSPWWPVTAASNPDRLDVSKNDLVTITLRSEGAPHSFAIDAYRVMKRAGAGETISFEFRADQAGRFVYYCSLSSERAVPQHAGHARGGGSLSAESPRPR